ncbi:MAG: 3'(2'),5'-bisphosphate nucleotidase CysQ [Chitinophagaceae bacterium]
MNELLSLSISAALKAGKEILKVYKNDFSVETKTDNSPLTLADQLAHNAIKEVLNTTKFPQLSEEGKQISYDERKNWKTFWLVDPLDGTKEFIKKNGEFTVNIALIENGIPLMGVVYIPVMGRLYYGAENIGSYCVNLPVIDQTTIDFNIINKHAIKLPCINNSSTYTIVASRSHSTPETEKFIEEKKAVYGETKLISSGSSIKLCLVAEGKAQVYPRLAPTMEWDTAAGQAVAKYAGCKVYDYNTKEELVYNKENLLNPWFVVERI